MKNHQIISNLLLLSSVCFLQTALSLKNYFFNFSPVSACAAAAHHLVPVGPFENLFTSGISEPEANEELSLRAMFGSFRAGVRLGRCKRAAAAAEPSYIFQCFILGKRNHLDPERRARLSTNSSRRCEVSAAATAWMERRRWNRPYEPSSCPRPLASNCAHATRCACALHGCWQTP